MNDELLDEIARFHAYTKAISGLMQEVLAAAPGQTAGRDSTGAAEATLTETGELVDLVISDNWLRHVDRGEIGRAVLNAVKDAEQQRFESAMTIAVDNGTIDRLEALDMNEVVPTRFDLPEPSRYPTVGTPQLVEETLQAVSSQIDTAPEDFVGTAETEDDLYTSVTLSRSGIVDCVVRIPWGMDAGGGAIAWAVKQAYDEAHSLLATGTDSSTDTFSMLMNDAIQALTSMQNQSPRGRR
ncbi:hypothetical protein [Nocardia abscessus]|uniref:hypothetical protein n=1 Tax=Nocardia abscessus TaxID=120957 RepID=UPI002455ED99|nr:hypothetical protein [Nocardia abscessus]